MAENLVFIGFVLLFVAIILIIIGGSSGKGDIKFGIGGFIGPIPFGFANDSRMLWAVAIISVILLIIFIIGFFFPRIFLF